MLPLRLRSNLTLGSGRLRSVPNRTLERTILPSFTITAHNNAFDRENSVNIQTHQSNSQSTYYVEEGYTIGNQIVGNGVYRGRYNFSPNLLHSVLIQHQPNVFDAKSITRLKQNANGHQKLNYVSDFDNKNRFAENFLSNGTKVGSEFSPMNDIDHNVNDNQRKVSSQHANVNASNHHHNQFGPYSANLRPNSFGHVRQFNANGICMENLNGHNNHLTNLVSGNGDQLNHWNYGQNMGAYQTSAYMGNSVSTRSNSYGYQRYNFGESRRRKHGGFSKKYQNSHMNNTHVLYSTLAAQYNHMNNGRSLHDGSRNISKGLAIDDGNPYGGANGIFSSSKVMLNQEPSKSFIPSSEQIVQGSSDNGSSETVEIISFEECMYKLNALCTEGKVKEAVATLAVLQKIGVCIDVSSYLKLMKVCENAKSLEYGKIVHAHLSWSLDDVDVSVHNEIIHMYSKCGSMAHANKLFLKLTEKNKTTWENMIKGFASNCLGEEAIDLFKEFRKTGLKPDGSLFNALFYTCGILSAVNQGLLYFKSMIVDYSISPTMEHYASIVNMLGRSGYLDEAVEFIESLLPIESNVDLWFTLMNYCRINGYVELGDRCAEIVDQLDPSKLTDEFRKGLLPLWSLELLEENEFQTSNDYDKQKNQPPEYLTGSGYVLNERVRCLSQHLKEAGYVPDEQCTLYDVGQEYREGALMFHRERLAMLYEFMTTYPRREVRIFTNLRACRDCHVAMKIASKLTARRIVMREDSGRFHFFSNGKCACNDLW